MFSKGIILKIGSYILNDSYRYMINCSRLGMHRRISDEEYLSHLFKKKMGTTLNIAYPRSFNEKIQWMKINDRRPEYTNLVDKYEVKKYVSEIIGEKYIVPTYGVWKGFDEIDFELLPKSFVLKCTHDSGGIVIVTDKCLFDEKKRKLAKRKLESSLKRNFYWGGREWPYKNVIPRIIAEKYLWPGMDNDLKDYKFFTFDGVAKAMFVASDRQSEAETKFDFYDMEFNHLDIVNGHPNSFIPIEKPEKFDEMKFLAEKISEGIPHCRVDFYEVDGKVYFGEITFYHWSGFVPFEPEKWDYIFGQWIKLPNKEE